MYNRPLNHANPRANAGSSGGSGSDRGGGNSGTRPGDAGSSLMRDNTTRGAGVGGTSAEAKDRRHGRDPTKMVWYWPTWLETCSPTGKLSSPEIAFAYFRESELMDQSSNNFNLWVQFGDDVTYDWRKMEADLAKVTGIQYHISPLSRPPDLWIFNKVLKSHQGPGPNTSLTGVPGRVPFGPGSGSTQASNVQPPTLLEIVVIVDGEISIVRSLEEIVGARLLSVQHSLSRSLESLRSRAPLPSVRQLDFWKSRPIEVAATNLTTQDSGSAVTATATTTQAGGDPANEEAPVPSGSGSAQTTSAPSSGPTKKKTTKKPDPTNFAILRAIETTRAAVPEVLNPKNSGDDYAAHDTNLSLEEKSARDMAMEIFRPPDKSAPARITPSKATEALRHLVDSAAAHGDTPVVSSAMRKRPPEDGMSEAGSGAPTPVVKHARIAV